MDISLKIMIIIFTIATMVGETRNIHIIMPTRSEETVTSMIAAGILILINFIILIVLMYRFYSNGVRKATVLLSCQLLTWIVLFIINATESDIKFLMGSLVIIIDTSGLPINVP